MISRTIQDALNTQINYEIYSSYLYYAMSAHFESNDLSGFAEWMRVQAMEELTHVTRFVDYLHERGGRVLLTTIEGPETDWESPLAVFQAGVKHEEVVSARINELVDLALKESDHATNQFLQWFVAEQVEEEASFNTVVQKISLAGQAGLFLLDQELGQRVFTPPATP